MDELAKQLGGLLLGSVPTIIFIVLLYGIYTAVVHKPLVKVLADRRSMTEGAMERARADIARAEARTSEYEQRLREARVSLFKSQEARRQLALQGRAAVVAAWREPRRRLRLIRPAGASSRTGSRHSPAWNLRVEGWQWRLFAPFCSRRDTPRREGSDASFAHH